MRERLVLPDFVRGFMLLFIVIANSSWLITSSEVSPLTSHHEYGNDLDRLSQLFSLTFIDGKIYPLYSLLFGYGIGMILRSRNVGYLIVRNIILSVFGILHAALFFSGDILFVYGIIGVIVSLLAIPGKRQKSLQAEGGGVVNDKRSGKLGPMGFTLAVLLIVHAALSLFGLLSAITSPKSTPVSTYQTIYYRDGGYFESIIPRIQDLFSLSPYSLIASLVLPSAILGFIMAENKIFEENAKIFPMKRLKKFCIALLPLSLLASGVISSISLDMTPIPASVSSDLYFLNQIIGLPVSLGYVFLIELFLEKCSPMRDTKVFTAIRNMGKNSLSFYILHSAILSILLSRWGLGIGESIGTFSAIIISTLIWLTTLVVAFSMGNRRGPLEKLLRYLSDFLYLNIERFRRRVP